VGAVIDRRASRVSAADALQYVANYVIVSDVTLPHDNYYRPSIKFRARDGFCPMSGLLPAQGFFLERAELVISVNGAEVARRGFADLVRPLPQLIADVTEFMTLSEGDVLLVGPPDRAPLAKPGDEVLLEVPGLGQLTHSLIAEQLQEVA
jgi:5-oxopent-3-ene-1,2,5-tricarboxylate decarboxylase/2-hydroxyhepta-2,4-diene-1,7-dioate isomerase